MLMQCENTCIKNPNVSYISTFGEGAQSSLEEGSHRTPGKSYNIIMTSYSSTRTTVFLKEPRNIIIPYLLLFSFPSRILIFVAPYFVPPLLEYAISFFSFAFSFFELKKGCEKEKKMKKGWKEKENVKK